MKALIDLLIAEYGLPPEAAAQTANTIMAKKKGPRGPVKEVESFDPEATAFGAGIQAINELPPGWDQFKHGALRGLQKPQPPSVMPNANVPKPTWGDLHNDPANDPRLNPPPLPRGHIFLPSGPVGMSDGGQLVNRDGAKLGHIPNQRTLERGPADVSMQDMDEFTHRQLEMMYGEDLRALEDNRGSYPPGYFDGVKPDIKQNRRQGVHELKRREKGYRI